MTNAPDTTELQKATPVRKSLVSGGSFIFEHESCQYICYRLYNQAHARGLTSEQVKDIIRKLYSSDSLKKITLDQLRELRCIIMAHHLLPGHEAELPKKALRKKKKKKIIRRRHTDG